MVASLMITILALVFGGGAVLIGGLSQWVMVGPTIPAAAMMAAGAFGIWLGIVLWWSGSTWIAGQT